MTARREASVARVAFGDGERNALDAAGLDAIASAVSRAASDSSIRVIVLASSGARFCSGLDLDAALSADVVRAYAACITAIFDAPKPVVARVHGATLGGGCGIAGACDHVVAAPEASFALPETIVGMIPVIASTVLSKRVAAGTLRSLALTGRTIAAADAHRIGLVDDLAEAGALDRTLDATLDRIARASPDAIAATKRWLTTPREEMTRAAEALTRWMERDDVRAGVRAFAAGQTPPWFSP